MRPATISPRGPARTHWSFDVPERLFLARMDDIAEQVFQDEILAHDGFTRRLRRRHPTGALSVKPLNRHDGAARAEGVEQVECARRAVSAGKATNIQTWLNGGHRAIHPYVNG